MKEDFSMRVFVTEATGHTGSLVVAELLDSGHEVLVLARLDMSAAALTAAGAQVHRGTLDDLDSLRAAAAASDWPWKMHRQAYGYTASATRACLSETSPRSSTDT